MFSEKTIRLVILSLASMWLACSVLVDFFVVPSVFNHLDDFFKAGELGIVLFSKFNLMEVVLGSLMVGCSSLLVMKNRKELIILGLSLGLFTQAMLYISWLSPKITELTALWKELDLMGLSGTAKIPDLQQEHQHYHQLYITLDSVKLFLLTALMALIFWREEKWN